MTPAIPHTVVIIEGDSGLCMLLQENLSAPNRVVDIVDSAEGLTSELVALSQPHLVILNPRIGGLVLAEIAQLVNEVRSLTGARFVLMLNETDAAQAEHLRQHLGADGAVSIRVLLRDPLAQLVPFESQRPPKNPTAEMYAPIDALDAETILGVELDDDVPLPPTPPFEAIKRTNSLPMMELSSLIDEELTHALSEPPKPRAIEAALDTVSEHNLYVDGRGQCAGIFISTVYPPPLGTELHVTVSFPWGARFEIKGVIAWARPDSVFGKKKRGGVGVSLSSTPAFLVEAKRFLDLRLPIVHRGA
jgi:hypothetical protein